MPGPTPSDLLFSPQANHNFSQTLSQLKKHTLSIPNRLQSILSDAAFIQQVQHSYQRPLIANERCGSWYIDPRQKSHSAYFKSTDGHHSAWAFSTRRLNLHLLDIIGAHDGCVIVDSTRRGKRMSDALSKTVPIWCAVLNRALFPEKHDCHDLYTPSRVVAPSEYAQIVSRLDDFVDDFLDLGFDVVELRGRIEKPLRPVWVTPESSMPDTRQVFDLFHPVVCCTASRRVLGGEVSEAGYIQGSGDDTENWALGLTPDVFWANVELLLSCPEQDLPELIPKLVASTLASVPAQVSSLKPIFPTSSLYITTLTTLSCLTLTAQRLFISLISDTPAPVDLPSGTRELKIPLGPHKLGSKQLRTILPTVVEFVSQKIKQDDFKGSSAPKLEIFVACCTGKDHSVGVCLALLCLFYGDDGHLREMTSGEGADKIFIKRRLAWITSAMPAANPSRATLQSVNSILIKPPN